MKGLAAGVFLLFALVFLFSPHPVQAESLPASSKPEYEGCVLPKMAQIEKWLAENARSCAAVYGGSTLSISPIFNQAIVVEGDGSVYHTVRQRDTLSGIAELYETSLEYLLLANPDINNPNLIYDGQKILIPSEVELDQMRAEKERMREEEQRLLAARFAIDNPKWIEVDLQAQTVHVFEDELLVKTFLVSTGTSAFPTVTGEFRIKIKLDAQDMRGPGYDLKDVPYVMYFYEDYALHGTYWHNNFGTPMSHGCVNLRTEDAAWLYEFAPVGTLVYVH